MAHKRGGAMQGHVDAFVDAWILDWHLMGPRAVGSSDVAACGGSDGIVSIKVR